MRIAVHAFDGITTFHLSAPLLTFGEVGRQGLAEGWSVTVWSDDGAPVRTAEGLVVDELAGPQAAEEADMLVLPSWPEHLPEPAEPMRGLVRRARRRGARVVGLCLGAFPVAAAGLLDGRTAATHWTAVETFAERFPAVEVLDDALYADHGHVLTSAGTASALDACLHLVRSRLGAVVATTVARQLVIAPHRDGDQAQYIRRPSPEPGEGPVGRTAAWALAHLDRTLSVAELAAVARMSPRQFSRRFRQEMGTTPARWIMARRLEEAGRLLEATDWSVERVARTCGFASAVTFRQNFAARYSTTPTSYRRRFAGLIDGP
ncbi:GlxA family transcriptional regulator [Nesterenkonia sp. F]|uniref:GlxA family transcriptional regulator n=1 Tax=Nesterenkonia sp. F TaxID=795955 RepID=UPI000255D0DE|nr:helix-turn-helix domain-containing protein [Nesterenkonia sp. F]